MKEIDEILEFFFTHESDFRVTITKKMKFGHRHYFVTFSIDDEPDKSNGRIRISESLEIIIDCRNQCIEVFLDSTNIIVEDTSLLEKWVEKLESYIEQQNKNRIDGLLETTLNKCYNKNLYREYQMNKILPDEDESI